MRIAFVTFEYPPIIHGGAGIYAAHIVEELEKLGHQIIVFTPTPNATDSTEYPPSANLQIWHVPVHETLPFRALQFWINLPREIKKAEKEQQFDIVHINSISYWFLKKRLSTAPHVLTVHHLASDAAGNTDLSFFSRISDLSGENGLILPLIERRAINSADKIIAVSYYTKDRILQTYQTPSDKVDVVYNGVDSEGYTFTQEDLDKTWKRLGLPDLPVILFVGRVDDPRKGLDVLIQAFRRVLDEVDATLLVVGKGDLTTARNLAGRALDRIVFTGFVDDITLKKCYALCDLYVCSSRLEGFGLTILEAFAAGKPVVATRVGAIPELVSDGIDGILVEKNDVSGIANGINYYLKYPESCKKNPNTKHATRDFMWSSCAKDVEKIYTDLVL